MSDATAINPKQSIVFFIKNLFINTFRYIVYVIGSLLIIWTWGQPFHLFQRVTTWLNIDPIALAKFLMEKSIKIGFIIGLSFFFVYLTKFLSNRIYEIMIDKDDTSELTETEARARTLINVANNVIRIIVITMAGFSILSELNVNIAPLLTGAGIIGLAIGFGAQSLVKDFFSGFFILMENQFAVGDVIKIGELAGLVEKVTLRTTVLRDLSGTVHTIPNGNISTVSNLTNLWSRAVLDISVAYKENVDDVIAELKKISAEIFADDQWKNLLIEEPNVLGVDALGNSGVTIKLLAKTKPIKQWDVMRELNRRIKNRFDELGIEIPFPHIKIVQDSKNT